MRTCAITCLFFLLTSSIFGQSKRPEKGYVTDAKTGVQIAEAVLIPVYGETKIESERPFVATLENNVWTVSGTLCCDDGKGGRTSTLCEGGTAVVKLAKSDARILSMMHYK
jgi:NTF2 fold immunity protein